MVETGDSRMADLFVCGNAAPQCGLQSTNWLAAANSLAGQRYQIGLSQASSGCRTDQYLSPSNFVPLLATTAQFVIFGYPAVNDIAAAGTGCAISPSGGSFPYTSVSGPNVGQSVNLSNVAAVASGNIIAAAKQALAAGKLVILTEEPGQTAFNNTPTTVASFNGQTSGYVLTVNSVSSGTIVPGSAQLAGSGVSSPTNIVSQLTGATGGVGTYSISASQSIIAEAMTATYSTLAALYEFNSYERAFVAANPGRVYLWSANSALWNPTGSATAISFKSGVLIDGSTHYNNLGGYLAGQAFNTFFQGIGVIPASDISISNIDSLYTSNPRSLINNPLFQTAAGGANTTCTLSSGTVPNSWTEVCGSGSTTVTITQANDVNGYGKAVTFAVTTTGADTFNFQNNSPFAAAWNVTDWLQAEATISVASGSSNCSVYGDNQINGSAGTVDSWLNFGGASPSGGGTNNGPTTAYSQLLRSNPAQAPAGSTTTGYISFQILAKMTAAGNCTFTVSRAGLNRVKVYNPVTNTFSGWLLNRDLGKPTNDNSPAFLNKAA
jgi:hypothetical protein